MSTKTFSSVFTLAQVAAELQNLADLDRVFDLRVEQENLTYHQQEARRAHLERCVNRADHGDGDWSFLDPEEEPSWLDDQEF